MIFLDVFLMLSIILDSLLLRKVRGKGLIENDITDILLICQCGFDGTFRPLSHFPRIFASNIVTYSCCHRQKENISCVLHGVIHAQKTCDFIAPHNRSSHQAIYPPEISASFWLPNLIHRSRTKRKGKPLPAFQAIQSTASAHPVACSAGFRFSKQHPHCTTRSDC